MNAERLLTVVVSLRGAARRRWTATKQSHVSTDLLQPALWPSASYEIASPAFGGLAMTRVVSHWQTLLLTVILLIFITACGKKTPRIIKLATTTSTENSGLLADLIPEFTKKNGISVQVIAVGTGKALKHGENGDVDALMVHAREAELEFVKKGYGVNRREFMYNDFVIAGPAEDPAGIKGMTHGADALKKIMEKAVPFISRGDNSGTHKKELELWKAAGIEPNGQWYVPAGQGMGEVLIIANEKQGYVLTDRGTHIAFEDKIDLPVLCEGDKALMNVYGVIAVNPARYQEANFKGAMAFINWICSAEAQKRIAAFQKNEKKLFYPLLLNE
jgi:tungstate transport system substrate-binding protein